jgi:protease-4
MARRRDLIIGVIIAMGALMALGMFGLMLFGLAAGTSDGFEFGGISGNSIGVVEVYGVIDDDMARQSIRQIERFTDNSSIQALVIHVNSPGGGVAPSQEIYDAILRAKEEKPVVISMASVAASGGYYIACAGDRIIANPGSLTGSIGVIFQFHTFQDLMGKVGIGTETVKSGELKDVGSYSRPMTDKEREMLNSVVQSTYEQFVDVVATGRGKEKSAVYPLADGSVYTGLQAYNLGLIDTLGGLHEAVNLAAELAEMTGEPKIVRPTRREKITIFDLLGQTLSKVNSAVDQKLAGPSLLYLYQ